MTEDLEVESAQSQCLNNHLGLNAIVSLSNVHDVTRFVCGELSPNYLY